MSLVGHELEFGQFRMDTLGRRLYRGSKVVPLSGKTFDLLDYMARNAGRPLLKKELLEAVWPASFVEESNLSQNIFVLRKAMGIEGNGLIETLPGRGYCFNAVVTTPSAHAMTTVVETTETRLIYEEQTEERLSFWRSPVTLGFAFAAVILLAVSGWLGWQRWEDHVGGPPVQVVIADTDGSTGDAALDRALSTVFRMELAQSPFVTILSSTNVKAKLVQMQHKPDEGVTTTLAREICERSGSQAVVHGSVAKAGRKYILTEEAINCVDGTSLSEVSREVENVDDLPSTLMKLANQIRHSVGESRRTIARFNHPLSAVTTGSLEALKDLTEAERLLAIGQGPESVDLLKQSVAIDPNFAAAWLDLSTYALNNRQHVEGRSYLTKAYNLRQYATEPTRRLIVARYNSEVTGDLYESLRNYQTWIDEYPRNVIPWSGMTVVNRDLGRIHDELNSAQHTMNLSSNYLVIYQALGDAQTRAGDFVAARSTLEAAIAKGFDGDTIRVELLKLGHILNDPALIAEQEAWGREHPFSPYVFAAEAMYAEIGGRNDEAQRLLSVALDACRHLGNSELINDILAEMIIDTSGLGRSAKAMQLLTTLKVDPTDPSYLYALESAGEDGRVETLLKEQLTANPQSTTWNEIDGPILRAKLLLNANKPHEALTALEAMRTSQGFFLDAVYLRGLAHLQLKQPQEAATEFQAIIAHPGIEPTAFQRPLAQLQLARVFAQQGNKPAAIEAYNAFLISWAHADPDQALLLAARSEFEGIKHGK